MLERNEFDALATLLLTEYYDPLYTQSDAGHVYAATIDAAEPARAARDVVRWIEDVFLPTSWRVRGSGAGARALPSSDP
jgi:hypothetical protein